MRMLHSLFVKLAMLAASIGLVCWIGWPAPAESPVSAMSDGEASVGAAPRSSVGEPIGGRSDGMTTTSVRTETGAAQRERGKHRSAITGPLELNHANAMDFESLPGIGPVLAQRVIEHRTAVGRFQRVDDLMAVKGIGPKIFERIKPLVTVAQVTTRDVKGKAGQQL